MDGYIDKSKEGFKPIDVDEAIKEQALEFLRRWLSDEDYEAYKKQIAWMADQGNFDYLLDSFYQVMPFGTGGRRGPVGIGPNRINPWTIAASAQGHADYLLEQFPDAAKRGIVIAYDCRQYPDTPHYNNELPNPVRNIASRDLALWAASVYVANGIPVHFFTRPRTTPELSFGIRNLDAVSGINISASHNPKEDNGKKIYNEDGGQLIPPFDQLLVDAVENIDTIKTTDLKDLEKSKLFRPVNNEVNEDFVRAVTDLSLSSDRELKVVFTPLHGVGTQSIYPVLKEAGFDVSLDPKTKEEDGSFSNVKFNIPNPEVAESFESATEYGNTIGADLALASDPDADRLGVAVKHHGQWRLLTGNEMSAILLHYMLSSLKEKGELTSSKVMATTYVTSNLCTTIAKDFGIEIIDSLMVGFKYIGDIMKKLEDEGRGDDFLIGLEESYGYLVGSYAHDKDAAGAALLICELAAKLKKDGVTVVEYLDDLYKKYGYVHNALSSIIMQGAAGKKKIDGIQKSLRENPPQKIGDFTIKEVKDFWTGDDHVSPTDTVSRNLLSFVFEGNDDFKKAKVDIRPSGTEPKTKVYIEVEGHALGIDASDADLEKQKAAMKDTFFAIERGIMKLVFEILDIDMPEHGYRLSSLLPLEAKVEYIKIEPQLVELKKDLDDQKIDRAKYEEKIDALLDVFGKDPIEKISPAFEAKYGKPLRDFLDM